MNESDRPVTVLQERIRERLDFLRRTARDVSLSAGLGAEAVRAILSGRSKSPRGDTLIALAKELSCDVSYLIGESNSPWPHEDLATEEDGTWHGVTRLEIVSWTEWASHFNKEDASYSELHHTLEPPIETDIASLIDYPPTHQYIDAVKDDHANRYFPPGTYLHCLFLHADNEIELRDRDFVVVEVGEKVSGGFMLQRTVRQVRIFNSAPIVFETISDNPNIDEHFRLRTERSPEGRAKLLTHTGANVTIAALVLRAIHIYAGPELERGRAPPA